MTDEERPRNVPEHWQMRHLFSKRLAAGNLTTWADPNLSDEQVLDQFFETHAESDQRVRAHIEAMKIMREGLDVMGLLALKNGSGSMETCHAMPVDAGFVYFRCFIERITEEQCDRYMDTLIQYPHQIASR